MAAAEFRVPHRLKVVFVWASVTLTAVLIAYQYHKRASYWDLHVSNAMQPSIVAPMPALASELESLFEHPKNDKKKQFTLYHFWATWCLPCRAEIPTLTALQKRFGDNLKIVTISADETKEDVLRFFTNSAPRFDVLWDRAQKVSEQWGVQKFPESFLVSSDGLTTIRFSGARDWSSPEAIDFLSRYIVS